MEDRTFDPNRDIALIMRSCLEDNQTSESTITTDSRTKSTLVQERARVYVRILVSSKHLILSLSVFEAMLQDRFKEG
jgi:hypothetical protein